MLLRWLAAVVAILPWAALEPVGALLGWLAGSVLRIRRAHVEQAMGAAGIEDASGSARGMYRALGASALEFLWLTRRGNEATRHVRIDAEQRGDLTSDQAVVEFHDNHMARAIITGKPAEFEQKRADAQQPARGHADQIVYNVDDGTVRLTDDAWLSDGQNEISGPLLIYNIRAQRVQAATAPGTSQRVHITITPHGLTPGAKGEAAPKPQPQPQP